MAPADPDDSTSCLLVKLVVAVDTAATSVTRVRLCSSSLNVAPDRARSIVAEDGQWLAAMCFAWSRFYGAQAAEVMLQFLARFE